MPQQRKPHKKVTRPNTLPERRRWHLDKNVSVANIISVLVLGVTIGGPVFYWGRAMESRVLSLEVINSEAAKAEAKRDTEASKLDIKRDSETREARVLINSRIDKIEDRLLAIQLAVSQLANVTSSTVVRK